MSKTRVDVMLDVHEHLNTELQSIFQSHDEVRKVTVADLDKLFGAADILIAGTAFERKTWPDYVQSIEDGRIDKQTERMGQVFQDAYVLVDGDMSETEELEYTQMEPTSLRGHVASLTAREESGVRAAIPCSNNELLADEAVRLARKRLEEPSTRPIQNPVDNEEPTMKRVLASIDGIGPELAGKLEQEFQTIPQIQLVLEKGRITEMDGVGPETEKRLKGGLL